MQNNPHRKKKSFVPSAFKLLVAVGSLAGTVGIWNFLANKDLVTSASADNSMNTDQSQSMALPPIPTLVPLITVSELPAVSGQSQTGLNPIVRDVIPPSPQAPSLSNPPANAGSVVNIPAPVATTKSSH